MSHDPECADIEALVYLLEEELDESERMRLAGHLAHCQTCAHLHESTAATRQRWLVDAIPAMPAPVRVPAIPRRSPGVAPWLRATLAAAAALLLLLFTLEFRTRAPEVGQPESTGDSPGDLLAVQSLTLDPAVLTPLPIVTTTNVPRSRRAAAPDASWSLLRSSDPTIATSAVTTLESSRDVDLPALPAQRPPRVGRIDAHGWEMADLVVRATPPASGATLTEPAWRAAVRVPLE